MTHRPLLTTGLVLSLLLIGKEVLAVSTTHPPYRPYHLSSYRNYNYVQQRAYTQPAVGGYVQPAVRTGYVQRAVQYPIYYPAPTFYQPIQTVPAFATSNAWQYRTSSVATPWSLGYRAGVYYRYPWW